MDDDDKAKLARQGLRAAELMEPGKIAEKVKGSVGDAVGGAALKGIAVVGRLTGKGKPERDAATERELANVDLSATFDDWDEADLDDFDARLRRSRTKRAASAPAAAPLHATSSAVPRPTLSELRRSFPARSRKLALLLFGCVDLLEQVAEGASDDAAERAKREALLTQIATLLQPSAGEALTSFVSHVVELSREQREPGGAD